jgi:hypothetical protein
MGAAPAALVEYLTLDNISNAYPARPRAVQPDAAFMADVRAALADMPLPVLQGFDSRLLGLYFVDDLGGTGFTDMVLNNRQQPVAGFIVLDAGVLGRRTANAWATWKENTPFKPQPGYTLQARIETDADDNRKNAIQYILLHELGHVLSIGGNIHPNWTIAAKDTPTTLSFPFFDLSWRIDRQSNQQVALASAAFRQRKSVVYYFGAKLTGSDMEDVYAGLEATNFVTLYGATNPWDDFAEAFASYVHTVLMKRPWQITLMRNGQKVKVIGSCWEHPRCAAKRAILEQVVSHT